MTLNLILKDLFESLDGYVLIKTSNEQTSEEENSGPTCVIPGAPDSLID